MNENTIGSETVANWMLLRGYATGHGDTIQDLLFEMEAQLDGPREPPPGEGDFKILQAENERLRALLSACKVAMEMSNENGGRTDWRHMIAGINSILQ